MMKFIFKNILHIKHYKTAIFLISFTIVLILGLSITAICWFTLNNDQQTSPMINSSGSIQAAVEKPQAANTSEYEHPYDATVDLLLLSKTKNKELLQDLFEIITMASSGTLHSESTTGGIGTPSQYFGLMLGETSTYANTNIPAFYYPIDSSGIITYNKEWGGYPKEAVNLKSTNKNVIHYNGSSGKIATPENYKGKYVSMFQITGTYFNASTVFATNPKLTPYKETVNARVSDPVYIPDLLAWSSLTWETTIKDLIPDETVRTEYLASKPAGSPALFSGAYNGGTAGFTDRITGKTDARRIDELTDDRISTSFQDRVLAFAKLVDNTYANMRKDVTPPSVMSHEGTFASMSTFILANSGKAFFNNNAKNYILSCDASEKKSFSDLLHSLSGDQTLVLDDWVKANTFDDDAYFTSLGFNKFIPKDKYNMSNIDGGWLLMFKSGATVTTKSGSTQEHYGFILAETLRHIWSIALVCDIQYAKLLMLEGVSEVSITDSSTYMNGNFALKQAIDSTSNSPNNNAVPYSNLVTTKFNEFISYFKNSSTGEYSKGLIGEVGWRDGMPIFSQSKLKGMDTIFRVQIPKRPKASNPKDFSNVYTGNSNTLYYSGCGMFTLTSVFHGIGLGNDPTIAAFYDEGLGSTTLVSPIDMMYFLTYLSANNTVPFWYYNGIIHAYPQWFGHFGIQAHDITKKDNLTELLKKGYPVITSTRAGYKGNFYSEDGTLYKSNEVIYKDPHIVAFYDYVELKVEDGSVIPCTKLLDTTGINNGKANCYLPISVFDNNAWKTVIESPIIKNNALQANPSNKGSEVSTALITGLGEEYWKQAEKDLLNRDFTVLPNSTNIRLYKVPVSNDIILSNGLTDKVEFEQVSGSIYNIKIYKGGIQYIVNKVEIASKVNEFPIRLVIRNTTNIRVATNEVDSSLKYIKPYYTNINTID